MAPANRPRSRSSPPSSRADAGTARVAGIDVIRDPERVRRAIGSVGQRIAVDRTPPGARTFALEGRIRGLRGIELQRPDRRAARSLRPRGARRIGWRAPIPAACSASSTWRWASSTARACSSSTSRPPGSTPRHEPSCGPRSAASPERTVSRSCSPRTTWKRPIGSPSRLAIVDQGRVVAAGSPDELKAELRGDAIFVELTDADARARRHGARAGVAGSERVARSTVARCALAPTVAHPRCRPSSRRSTRAGIGVASVTVSRPSLDDVYLRHTGRAFRADRGVLRMTAIAHSAVHDAAPHPGAPATAVVRRHHPRAADHLAAPVRRALPQRHRDPRLRGRRLLSRLPGAGRRDHDGADRAAAGPGWGSSRTWIEASSIASWRVRSIGHSMIVGRISYEALSLVIQATDHRQPRMADGRGVRRRYRRLCRARPVRRADRRDVRVHFQRVRPCCSGSGSRSSVSTPC